MLSKLSYFNLLLSVLYFFTWLQDGGSWAIGGLLLVIVFNWATLRNIEKQQFNWPVFQWVTGLLSILFAVYLCYGAVVLLLDAAEHQYYPGATVLLVISELIFAFSIILQVILAYMKKTDKKTE